MLEREVGWEGFFREGLCGWDAVGLFIGVFGLFVGLVEEVTDDC